MRKSLLATAMLGALACANANAEGVYGGLKYINAQTDVSGLDAATNAGLLLGYEFGKDDLRFAVEGEFTKTVSDGEGTISGFPATWSVDTMAVYGVVRYGKEFYVKGKAGYLNEDAKISAGGVSSSGSDSGMSYGIGAGYRATDSVAIEAEYTIVEEDINFLSLGVNIAF